MHLHNIHFAHANGFGARTYEYLFELLNEQQVRYVDKLGHGRFRLDGNWHNLAEEVVDSVVRQFNQPVIGIGHSLGAVLTLMAAAKRPELFHRVILLDPVLFSKRKRYPIKLLRALGLGDWIGPIRRTRVRKARFDTLQQAKDYFAGKTLFKDFHPRCLDDYIRFGLKPLSQLNPLHTDTPSAQYELDFAPAIEADIFRTLLTRVPPNVSRVKGVMIYGDRSEIVHGSDVRWWQRKLPQFELVKINGGHLFPLEQPEATAQLIRGHLALFDSGHESEK